MNELKLTVQDVLQRKSFHCAKVIAGRTGLNRQVKWSHILETKDFESLINGGELILTTGVGLRLDRSTQLQYVKKLIEKEVAAICIEIGPHFSEIPIEIINLANENNFPIIAFEEVVKFVDITQDLHTHIINQHHEMLSQLDTLSRKFISLSLSHNGILKILQELHKRFQQNAIFIDKRLKPYYYPAESKEMIGDIHTLIEQELKNTHAQKIVSMHGHHYAFMPVQGLGQTWGYLCLQFSDPYAEDFLFLLLDRAALGIAQILLRNRTIEERKQNMEDELVRNLLNGRSCDEADLHTYLPTPSRNMYYRIFVIQLNVPDINMNEEDWEEIKLQRSMTIRALFKQNGFFPAVSVRRNEIAVIAFFLSTNQLSDETDRFTHIINEIIRVAKNNFSDENICTFGISTVYQNNLDVMTGYDEARKVLALQKKEITNNYFYENLGVYRLLLLLIESNYLETYVKEYLSPVINYDRETDSNLFETLTVYLECSGSKKETSERLFIVRQTLYHRLDRLETLLGKDFMKPPNRLAYEVAIKAYELLKNVSRTK
ncbi:PucR family transcriptional regulator [Sporosarcina ureilytica]|uniref:PucR family transcriptional regulator n=1 Tax=Sporosarcina ureilytica TaxID=298596 RepID=A0A1D8JBZ1_9BACL|nr:PucR family transcriptional regulator [Sporosarcina ureilytica]AOV06223.1 PucR family transcriptional regulator [Sporosarcina ureilytica]